MSEITKILGDVTTGITSLLDDALSGITFVLGDTIPSGSSVQPQDRMSWVFDTVNTSFSAAINPLDAINFLTVDHYVAMVTAAGITLDQSNGGGFVTFSNTGIYLVDWIAIVNTANPDANFDQELSIEGTPVVASSMLANEYFQLRPHPISTIVSVSATDVLTIAQDPNGASRQDTVGTSILAVEVPDLTGVPDIGGCCVVTTATSSSSTTTLNPFDLNEYGAYTSDALVTANKVVYDSDGGTFTFAVAGTNATYKARLAYVWSGIEFNAFYVRFKINGTVVGPDELDRGHYWLQPTMHTRSVCLTVEDGDVLTIEIDCGGSYQIIANPGCMLSLVELKDAP